MTEEGIKEHHDMCEDRKKSCAVGEWTDEPNRLNWKHKGLDCMIVRNGWGLHLCGYVGVKPGHPAFGKHYNDIDVDVHGGLTYSEECSGSICHIPEAGEEDQTHWFGFDCAHLYDHRPGHDSSSRLFGDDPNMCYKNIAFVKAETEKLAEQLAVM